MAEYGTLSGVPAVSGDRAETLLLDLVRAGIENDFERVVFPVHPELREVKRLLESEAIRAMRLYRAPVRRFTVCIPKPEQAEEAAAELRKAGTSAQATVTLGRGLYLEQRFV